MISDQKKGWLVPWSGFSLKWLSDDFVNGSRCWIFEHKMDVFHQCFNSVTVRILFWQHFAHVINGAFISLFPSRTGFTARMIKFCWINRSHVKLNFLLGRTSYKSKRVYFDNCNIPFLAHSRRISSFWLPLQQLLRFVQNLISRSSCIRRISRSLFALSCASTCFSNFSLRFCVAFEKPLQFCSLCRPSSQHRSQKITSSPHISHP